MPTVQTRRPPTHGCRDRSDSPGTTWKDDELVVQFLEGDEESSQAAFQIIVGRHGPLVMGVCRQALHNEHDAEDAFQATFLTLCRKAETIRDRRMLSSWLYEVAYRIALKARARSARRRDQEGQGAALTAEATLPLQEQIVALNDLQPVLHDEVNRLPDKYRLPIVLTYLEGKSNEEVAELLEWPVGTVKGRLFRARNLLRDRLERRGLVLSASFVCMALGHGKVEGAVLSDTLIERTARLVLGARLEQPASSLKYDVNGSPALPEASASASDAMSSQQSPDKRKKSLEFLFFVIALLSLGFAAYSYISSNPLLMGLLKKNLMWAGLWGNGDGC